MIIIGINNFALILFIPWILTALIYLNQSNTLNPKPVQTTLFYLPVSNFHLNAFLILHFKTELAKRKYKSTAIYKRMKSQLFRLRTPVNYTIKIFITILMIIKCWNEFVLLFCTKHYILYLYQTFRYQPVQWTDWYLNINQRSCYKNIL